MSANEPDDGSIDELGVEPARVAATTPRAGDAEPDLAAIRERVLASLRARHAIPPKQAVALIGGGMAVILIIGVILSVILYAVSLAMGRGVTTRAWLILYLLVMAGVVVLVERRQRHGFFSFTTSDVDLTRDGDSRGEVMLKRTGNHLRSALDLFWFGPRAVAAGVDALRGVPQGGLERVLPEAADTLTLMLSIDSAVKIKDLAPPGEDPMSLMPVLVWLDANDYIGISSKGDRVWVSSPAKKRFAADGIFVSQLSETAK